MKKQILKRAACVVILTGIVIGAICGWKYYENEQRKKQPAYFTDKKITAYEMAIMVDFYHVKSTPVYPWDLDEDKWPDYSYCTIEPTEDTEKIAVVMNYALANELFTYDAKAIEQYKKYGFSEENPITVAWIMDNPKKAVNIMKFMAGGAWRYQHLGDWVYPTYEKLTGETEDMSEGTEDATSNEVKSTE
ncbi:MAG: hypothetical protein MR549_00065 [Lachnobacterium sp.]|nr:hypothetical protein [Lachnobacterium sp.]